MDGVSVAGVKISNLRFVDDITIIAVNEDKTIEQIQRMEELSSKFGLKINRKESEIMILHRSITLQITYNFNSKIISEP